MKLIEFKAGETYQPLEELLANYFEKHLKDLSFADYKKNYIIYVSDRRIKGLGYNVKPRAKIIFLLDDGVEFEPPKIVFESKQLVVFDKPIGLPTQSTLKKHEDNLYDRARIHFMIRKDFPGGLPYVGLHHRLDRDTSGLVLMTKMRSANKEISDLFKERKIKKSYLAFTEANKKPEKSRWTFKCNIERGFSKRHPFIFKAGKNGDEAISSFQLLESTEKYHLIECMPKTGRTHQIRVQLAEQGYPVLGDRLYGRKAVAQRLMLHAYQLEFRFQDKDVQIKSSLDNKELINYINVDKI